MVFLPLCGYGVAQFIYSVYTLCALRVRLLYSLYALSALFLCVVCKPPLDGEHGEHFDEFFSDGFFCADGVAERYVDYFIVFDADHHVALSFADGTYGAHAETAGEYTVAC